MTEERSKSGAQYVLARLLSTFDESGKSHAPAATVLLGCIAVPTVLLHMLQTQTFFLSAGEFKAFHLTICLVILLIAGIEKTPPQRVWRRRGLAAMALLALVPLFYIQIEYQALVDERPFLPSNADLIVTTILLVVTLFVAMREWGIVIPIIAIVGIAYGLFGYLLPEGFFAHAGIGVERLLGYTGIPYFRGLLGNLTGVSAGITFMFLIYAGLMKATGGLDYVMKLAFVMSGRSRSGPAQAAVISSGFMGMISGSIMANVASTGAFTIPLMKRVGFRGSFAGAVEAVASAAGQFTPPKMGLAAFLIVGLTGIPYVDVMAAAIFPSVVIYLYLAIAVQLHAVKHDIHAGRMAADAVDQLPLHDMTIARATIEFGHLFLSLAVLVYFLLIQFPAGTAAVYACLTLMALEMVKQIIKHRERPLIGLVEGLRLNAAGLVSGARGGANVAIVIATISIMVEMLIVTGFAQKLSHLMLDWSGQNLGLLLVLAAVTCLVFGLGLPTSAAYILVALLGAPALVELGVPLLAAHLFVFYLAIMSALTPPVATGALVASSIAKADFFRTGFTAVRLGLPGFVLPFVFVLRPEMLMLQGGLLDTLFVTIVALIGIAALNVALEGYLWGRMSWLERILLVPAAIGLLHSGLVTTMAGFGVCGAVALYQFVTYRGKRAAAQGTESKIVPRKETAR